MSKKKLLVIGSGGREDCLVWKILQSPQVEEVYCCPGNAGIAKRAKCIDIDFLTSFDALINFAQEKNIDMTVVGPESPLVDGIVDAFESRGLKIFGPSKNAAMLEGSKSFAKEIMTSANVPTAKAEVFDNEKEALKFIKSLTLPFVIKADGLAAGKGVSISKNIEEAKSQLNAIFDEKVFGNAGTKVVIEEFLSGEEASVLAFVDNSTIVTLDSSQDHKPIYDGDKGPNTGGMGAYSPAPIVDKNMLRQIQETILEPTINELRKRNITYKGIIYAGIMVTKEGPKVLEFNCRFGDPETQAVLPRLENDIVELFEATINNQLSSIELKWKEKWAVCVIAASDGYPGKYEKGKVINNLDLIKENNDAIIFYAGVSENNGKLITSGGRVLGLTTLDILLSDAIKKNYELLKRIHFDGIYYRRDIGYRALKSEYKIF